MAVEIVMPKLGWTMEEGILVEWIKQDGEQVQPGDILFTVESDKALNEVESFETGILRIPPDSDAVGKPLPVGALLAYIVKPGETPPFEQTPETGTMPAGGIQTQTTPVPSIHGSSAAEPSTVPLTSVTRLPDSDLPTISPRARRVAADLGVDWTALTGSGRTGRIVERDVRAAALVPPSPLSSHVMQTPITQTPATSAARAQSTTLISVTTEADTTELVRLHQRIQAARQNNQQPMPGFDNLLAKLVGEALRQDAQLDARLEDGTFTIMDLGMYEIDAFAPAMSVSQSAILGVGRIVAKQIVINAEKQQVAIRQMMFLSLTCDAQTVDAASAARFLHLIKQYVEQPVLWLVNLS